MTNMKENEFQLEEMVHIQMDWNEVKGRTIDWQFNALLLMAWVYLVEEDDIVKVWEIRFKRT